MSWESQGVALLTASLVRPFGLAVAAWLILRVLRVRHPASQHAVWTAVLIGMTILPIVSVIAPHWKAPLLPRSRKQAPPPQPLASEPAFTGFELPAVEMGRTSAGDRPGGPSYKPSSNTLVLCCYLAGLLAMVTYRVAGWALLWRVVSRSRPLRGRLRESCDVLTPVAVGVLRPAVLLPAGWRTWNTTTRRAVPAHEFAHLRRHDTLVSALARLVQCVFWFHPLAWWVSRKISGLAELACDAAVLERVDDPVGYSRILLAFADAVNHAGHRVALPGLAMAASSGIGRRIDQVFELSSGKLRRLSRPGVLLALIGLPVLSLAATVGFVETQALSPRPSVSPIAPAQPPPFAPAPVQGRAAPKIIAQQTKAPQIMPRPAPTPKFEVASVKPCKEPPAGRGGGSGQPPGRLHVNCETVKDLIRDAYDLLANGRMWKGMITRNSRTVPIEGGPGWIDSERYYIDAKAEGPETQEMMKGPMMRTLLEDRFKLKIRRETRPGPVYELKVAQGGPKLEPVENGSCIPLEDFDWRTLAPGQKRPLICNSAMVQSGKLAFLAMSIADFCQNLTWDALDRPVIDKTGIAGKFNFRIEFAPDEATPFFRTAGGDPSAATPEPTGPSIFTALREQLGLKLESAKGPVEFLVIEHVERPSEN
jgi:bla regulator protein BlaR1